MTKEQEMAITDVVFESTANPMTRAHVALVEHVVEVMKPKRVWVVITWEHAYAWKNEMMVPYRHRLEMGKLAFEELQVELAEKGVEMEILDVTEREDFRWKYTADLMKLAQREVVEEGEPEPELALIMGSDNWVAFHTWHRGKEIVDQATIIVVPRGDETRESVIAKTHEGVAKYLKGDKPRAIVLDPLSGEAKILRELSSTSIREKLLELRERIVKLVGERVLEDTDGEELMAASEFGELANEVDGLEEKVLAYLLFHGLYLEEK